MPGLLENVPVNVRRRIYYQYDGATAHFARVVKSISWAPRSPDLTSLNFCLSGWFKAELYKVKVNSGEALIQRTNNTGGVLQEKQE